MGIIKAIKNFRILVTGIIIIFFIFFLLSRGYVFSRKDLEYGVTFSHKQAMSLGLDWKETYLAILDDLGVKKIRMSSYWDEIEKEKRVYDWGYLDYQVDEAEKRGVEIIFALGGRMPRWPECHFPKWTEGVSEKERQDTLLEYMRLVIERYKGHQSIVAWQVENEPFLLNFGECPPLDKAFLDKEAKLIRSLDNRPIMLTDSGELSLWVPAAKRADIFGTTMYLDTYSKKLDSYIHYPIEPGFFRFKRNLTRLFANPKKWVVIELQAEPWGPIPFQDLSKEERDITMDSDKFKKVIEFSSKTGFKEFYLWGAEWWYWEKIKNGDDRLWEEAKKLFHK